MSRIFPVTASCVLQEVTNKGWAIRENKEFSGDQLVEVFLVRFDYISLAVGRSSDQRRIMRKTHTFKVNYETGQIWIYILFT